MCQISYQTEGSLEELVGGCYLSIRNGQPVGFLEVCVSPSPAQKAVGSTRGCLVLACPGGDSERAPRGEQTSDTCAELPQPLLGLLEVVGGCLFQETRALGLTEGSILLLCMISPFSCCYKEIPKIG